MGHNQVIEKLTLIFREVFSDNSIELRDNMTADDVERWDSLSHMIMITTVEKEFNIKFKLKDLNKMKQVGDLISTIEGKLG
jgi:acyl carrier protein